MKIAVCSLVSTSTLIAQTDHSYGYEPTRQARIKGQKQTVGKSKKAKKGR